MKLSTYIGFIVILSGVFLLYSTMTMEANTYYPDAGINNSEWAIKYDMTSRLNTTLLPLKEKFDVIQNENTGFFTKIGAGIVAIPYAVILVPQVAFESLSMGTELVTNIITDLGLDPKIVLIATLLLILMVIFALLGFYQRYNI